MLLNAIYDHVMLPVPHSFRFLITLQRYDTRIQINIYFCSPYFTCSRQRERCPSFVVKLSPHQWSYLCQHRFRCPRKSGLKSLLPLLLVHHPFYFQLLEGLLHHDQDLHQQSLVQDCPSNGWIDCLQSSIHWFTMTPIAC